MGDLTSSKLIYAKGLLFLFSGLLAAGLLIAEHPSLRVVLLLSIAIWCFARAYYFAFYVIAHYVDPSFRFAGLGAFVLYLMHRRTAVKEGAGIDREDAGRQAEAEA